MWPSPCAHGSGYSLGSRICIAGSWLRFGRGEGQGRGELAGGEGVEGAEAASEFAFG